MATNWLKRLFGVSSAPPPVEPGLHTFPPQVMETPPGEEEAYTRFHLRVERDGSGMLIANAAATARLSPTGVVIARGLLEGRNESEILEALKGSFAGASEAQMQGDIAKVRALVEQIMNPGDTYPVFNLEDAAISPYSAELIAPLQATLRLEATAGARHAMEQDQLLPLLTRLWEVGIPHVTLLVPPGETSQHELRDDLLHAVERAEDLGMIAGVRGRATELWNEATLSALRDVGVDHITFLYASADPAIHDALCGSGDHAAATALLNWLEERQVCAIAEIPLVEMTLATLDETIETLLAHGADNLSFVAYASEDEDVARRDGIFTANGMAQVATTVEEAANFAQARFMWNPPLERDPSRSLAAQVQDGPRSYGDVSIHVEPDGEVIPPRGPWVPAGNLLRDSWEEIWDHEVFRIYRDRVEAPTRCDLCPGLAICAADCPREPAGWALYQR